MHDYSAQALDAPVQNPDGLQGFLTQSGRKICRQGGRGEMLNRLSDLSCPCRGGPPFLAPPRKGAKESGSRGYRLLRISNMVFLGHNFVLHSMDSSHQNLPDFCIYPRVLSANPQNLPDRCITANRCATAGTTLESVLRSRERRVLCPDRFRVEHPVVPKNQNMRGLRP